MYRILIIEDEKPVRENLVDLLTVEGYIPLQAADGEQGLRMAREALPDLVLCDINMPRMDGYTVLQRLNSSPSTSTIPFIFLTARTEREDLRRGMNMGADDFITKPFSCDEVINAIQARLEKHAMIQKQAELKQAELRMNTRLSLPEEMLSPLGVILGASEMLAGSQGVGDAESGHVRTLAREIQRSSACLLRSIQNYILYTELETIPLDSLRAQEMRSNRVLSAEAAIAEMASYKARQEGREADLVVRLETTPLRISEMYLQKIVEELLEIAFRVSPVGSPVQLSGDVLNNLQQYRICVQARGWDTPALQETGSSAFPCFPEQQWQGMGITIVRQLVDLHGGSFQINSSPDQGTVIEVHVPLSE